MARMKHGARSQAIRDYLAINPEAGPKEIVESLRAAGVKVTLGLASNIKYGGNRPKGKRGRKGRRSAVRVAVRRNGAAAVSVVELVEVKRLADSLGGLDQVRQAVEALEQLQ